MNRVPLRAFFKSLAFTLITLPIRAQISFFQPPTYAGSGNVFVADFTLGTKVSVPSGFSVLAVGGIAIWCSRAFWASRGN